MLKPSRPWARVAEPTEDRVDPTATADLDHARRRVQADNVTAAAREIQRVAPRSAPDVEYPTVHMLQPVDQFARPGICRAEVVGCVHRIDAPVLALDRVTAHPARKHIEQGSTEASPPTTTTKT